MFNVVKDTIKSSPKHLFNKYVVTSIVFVFYMIFVGGNSYIQQRKLNKELSLLTEKKLYYKKKLEQIKTDQKAIMSNPKTIEKFARENYLMKKEDEDLYLVKSNEP